MTEIKIACIGPRSGQLVFLGKPALQACQMAVDEFNARTGGVDGVKVQSIPLDESAEAIEQVVGGRSFLGVAGPMTSAAALSAAAMLDAPHIALISPSASHPKLTESGWKIAHRLAARDDAQGPADAVFLFGPPVYARHMYVVDEGTAGSVSLADEFQKRAAALGMKVERASLTVQDDPGGVVAKAASAKVNALFFAGQGTRCAAILQALHKQAGAVTLMTGPGCHDTARLDGAGEGMFTSDIATGVDASPAGQAWAASYLGRFGAAPGQYAAQAFDATRILLQAIQNAAAAKGSLDIRPAEVNLQVGKTTSFSGITGPITFDAKGDVQPAPIFIYQLSGGAFKQVKAA